MRYKFVAESLRTLVRDGWLRTDESVLAVCAGAAERSVFLEAGLQHATISNLDGTRGSDAFAPFEWSFQNAQNLAFEDSSFDHVFVSDGLHHCDSPHRGLLEMFRVARKSVIVFESRDSLLMKLAERLGLAAAYEVEAVIGSGLSHGGVNNTEIPNYVYRWTEREFEKSVASFYPLGPCRFKYFYGLNLPDERLAMNRSAVRRLALGLLMPLAKGFGSLLPRQGNSFGMVAKKPDAGNLWPWLARQDGVVRFRKDFSNRYRP